MRERPALTSLSPVLHYLHTNVVSAEEVSLGLAEFWSGNPLFAFTHMEDGDLTLRVEPDPDGVMLGAHALAEALAEADGLLALY
jgi:hypothetical protein